jgi:hypothetical protein
LVIVTRGTASPLPGGVVGGVVAPGVPTAMESGPAATQSEVKGQETAKSSAGPVEAGDQVHGTHAPAPPVGSVEIRSLPTATHSEIEAHETPSEAEPDIPVQELLPARGSVVHKMAGSVSDPATHRDGEGQETDHIAGLPGALASVHAPAPPVGFTEVASSPMIPTPTHNEAPGHDIPQRSVLGRSTTVHAPEPPVGLVEVTTPSVEPATQKEVEGQEIAWIVPAPGTLIALHALAPPAGSVDTTTPLVPPATQKEVEGQEIP